MVDNSSVARHSQSVNQSVDRTRAAADRHVKQEQIAMTIHQEVTIEASAGRRLWRADVVRGFRQDDRRARRRRSPRMPVVPSACSAAISRRATSNWFRASASCRRGGRSRGRKGSIRWSRSRWRPAGKGTKITLRSGRPSGGSAADARGRLAADVLGADEGDARREVGAASRRCSRGRGCRPVRSSRRQYAPGQAGW